MMGVHVHPGTIPGGVTPICNDCGVSLCWDISEDQYERECAFWDDWKCRDCNGGEPMSRAALRNNVQGDERGD
jgi:hypothetical protein